LVTAALLLLSGHFVGCEPENWILNPDCNECFGFQPDTAKLIVYLTIDQDHLSVPLTFYRENEQGEVDWRDTATGTEFYLDAAIGKTYAVRAEYRSGPGTIIAYDSDVMRLSDYGDECGDPCYIVKGGILDLRLKD
jgi:hypothetical protein